MNRLILTTVVVASFAGSLCSPAATAELKILSPAAMRSSMLEIIPAFENSSGHKVKADFGPAGALAQRIQAGDVVDVGIVTEAQIDELQKAGKIIAGTKVGIARVGIGVFAPRGAGKVEIATLDSFKRALLGAKSIGYNDPASGAPSGAIAAKLLSGLDIAPAITTKIKLFPAGTAGIYRAVENAEVEIALGQMTEIMDHPNIQLLGPLPSEIQNYTSFASGIVTAGKHQEFAKSFIAFLASPGATAMMRAKGLEPLR
jgi:molybdate transport system substrate-binding protein